MTRHQRFVNLGIAAAIAVVAVIVIVVASGGSDDGEKAASSSSQPAGTTSAKNPQASSNEPPPIAIAVKNGKVVGGITKIRVKQGDQITFTVTADVADEVHVHAYDFHKDIEKPGDTVKFSFKATITGITEAELEDAHLQIASIRVDP